MDRTSALQALQRMLEGDPQDDDAWKPEVMQEIVAAAAADPSLLAEAQEMLEKAGAATTGPAPPLDIGALYPGGDGPYELKWPLQAPQSFAFSFDDLDRKTQFFVLCNEWTYRDMQAWSALTTGSVDVAEAIFTECVERAVQLEVGELEARSYDGLQEVADKRGRAGEAEQHAAAALAARRR
jgi:hypothetical protein